jgi:hypothetical protein
MPNYQNAKKVPTTTDSLKERAIESQRLLQVVAPTPTVKRPQDDGGGWTEVKRKIRKVQRELTVDEMDARERRLQALNEATDGEFNGELFDSKRHDHDRV